MSTSLLGTGGVASVPIGATPSSPAVLYDALGTLVSTPDGGRCNAYKITNTDGSNWLWIRLGPSIHAVQQGTPVMPNETITFVCGYAQNGVRTIQAWGTTPGVGGSAVAVVVAGGIQKAD